MGTSKRIAGGNPVMDEYPIPEGSRNTPETRLSSALMDHLPCMQT